MKKMRISLADVLLIVIFLFIALSLLFNSSSSGSTSSEGILSPKTVNELLITEYNKTPLSPEFNRNSLSGKLNSFKYSFLNFISSNKITGYFLNFLNKSRFGASNCSTCSSGSSCSDLEALSYYYPVDISLEGLHSKMKFDKKLLIIDVRNEEAYLKKHIPSSVNMPLLDITNFMSTVDRWSEIVIVGDGYIQTKLAAEALQRLNFHRVHRLTVSVDRWDGQFESFIR